MRCNENFFGYEDNQFEDLIAPKKRENSEVLMQNSATAALFEEDGGQNIIRHESAYKIFAPKQLVTAGEEEEKQHKQHVYNH